MNKREQYNLRFEKLDIPDWGIKYFCSEMQSSNDAFHLSDLLNHVSNREPEDLLEETDNVLNGSFFEKYYVPDGALFTSGVTIVPPKAVINEAYEISLLELKALLEEWIDFVNQ